jgi:SpoVK/Ycf46/Vps4 family AAA+-type ATPase
VYVPLPDERSRVEILKKSTKKTPLDKNVDLEKIGKDKRCKFVS